MTLPKGLWFFLLLTVIFLVSGCLGTGNGADTTVALKGIQTDSLKNTTTPSEARDTALVVSEKTRTELIKEPDFTAFLDDKYKVCIGCHGNVEPFHTVAVISRIDEAKGLNPRVCIVCHGQKVHDIHWDSLLAESINCDTCHNLNGVFTKPEAEEGQLLVCELCHSRGNYIKIHIEGNILEDAPIGEEWIKRRPGHQCDTCHIGDYGTIHFAPLMDWREQIGIFIEEAHANPPTPLNISYT